MGTEKALMQTSIEMLDAWQSGRRWKPSKPLGVVNSNPESFGPGTLNHRGLGIEIHYVGSVLHGLPFREAARIRLLRFLETQRTFGHCCLQKQDAPRKSPETFSSSHGQLNLAWAAVCLYASRLDASDTHSHVNHALRHWWWTEIRLCELTLLPGAIDRDPDDYAPTFWGPGWRGKSKSGKVIASNPCRDLCGRLVLGYPVPEPSRDLWRDKYNLAARALSLLPIDELARLRPADDFQPVLPYAFRRLEYPNGDYLATFDGPTGKPGELTVAAGSVGGERFAVDHRGDWPWTKDLTPNKVIEIPGVNPWEES